MTTVLVAESSAGDNLIYNISTPEMEDYAYLHLFSLRDREGYYCPLSGPEPVVSLPSGWEWVDEYAAEEAMLVLPEDNAYWAVKNAITTSAKIQAIKKLLSLRQTYEMEGIETYDLIEPPC